MKALTIEAFGGIEQTHLKELPIPAPAANEVQIKTAYTGVNPVDWKICAGYLKKVLPHQFPLIPGWDASGTITALGKQAKSFSIGDQIYVYCRKPTVQWGTYAEYVCCDASYVALKPRALSLAQAAAIPLVALTAWQSLFEAAELEKGQTILIHAGAGGVGSLAIQFAKHAGATVFTTASARNHDYVKNLGADFAIDYTREDFGQALLRLAPEGVDVVYDCVGESTLDSSYPLVKKGGCLVSIVNRVNAEKCEEFEIRGAFVFVRPDGKQLKTIAELIDGGEVQAPFIEEMSFDQYEKAWEKIKGEHTKGKIVLRMA